MFRFDSRYAALVAIPLLLSLGACSEPTPESRAQAEASFPDPDQSVMTADRPKETPQAFKDAMQKIREGAAEIGSDAKDAGHKVGVSAGDLADDAKEVGRKVGDGAVELGQDVKQAGADLLDKAREAIHDATAK